MKEFCFLNYRTEYACSGDFNLAMRVKVCFADAFHRLGDKESVSETYVIKVYKQSTLKEENHSNMCYFTRKQIKNHIDQLKDLFPIRSSVIDVKGAEKPHFVVTMRIENLPSMCHKYALTWLRYLYEYPYNMISYDAYRLKQDPKFRFESIANLFNLVAGCCCEYVGEVHAAVGNDPVGFLRRRELKAKLREAARVNHLYMRIGGRARKRIPDRVGELTSSDFEYWDSDKIFEEERKPIYMKAYNKIKDKKIKK